MKEWPNLLSYLHDTYEYNVNHIGESFGINIFEVDFSSWKLRLSDQTPVVWVKAANIQGAKPKHIYDSIKDLIREWGLEREITIIILDGKGEPLKKYTSSPLDKLVVVGNDEQKTILHSNRPSGVLQDLIAAQIPISKLAPYEITAPVTGSRFFGRDPEVSRLTGESNTNYLVLGIRRIGKTSLLMEAIQRLSQKKGTSKEENNVVYLDCSDFKNTNDFVREVVRKLEPKELPRVDLQKYIFYFPDFLERMKRKSHKQIVLVLDEIDRLISSQHEENEVFRMLRVAFNQGHCRFVFAGFRDAQYESNEINSPLYNFSVPLYLSEFSRQQAKDLIIRPMESLRIHINNPDDVVGRIYEETAGYPNLIQYYCMVLIRKIEQTKKLVIDMESLIDVYSDIGFKYHLLSSFIQNTHNREKAIVFALLQNTDTSLPRSFTHENIDNSLRQQSINLSLVDIDTACTTLRTTGFLKQVGREYFFASQVFVKVLLEHYDPVYSLLKVKEEGL